MIKFSPENRVREDTVTNSNFRVVSCKFPFADRLSSRGFRDLPQLLHVNDRMVSYIRLKFFPSTTTPNYILPLRLKFDATD